MWNIRSSGRRLLVLLPPLLLAGCARNQMLLEMRGSLMYEKPQIRKISHVVTETSLEGGAISVEITLWGDPGLTATFDISPGIAERQPMIEVEDGRYEGRFSFAADTFGGPYWVTGRLRHDPAGENLLRDSSPLMIALPDR